MPTAVESMYSVARLGEIEPAPRLNPDAENDGRASFDVRRTLGITGFGVRSFTAPNGGLVINEHDELFLGADGQEELYIVTSGAATFEIDGETVEAPTGALINVQPAAKRKATATEDGTMILVVGGTPGKPYEPQPEEAAEALAAYGKGDYEEALAKQLIAVEKQPNNPVAHFNVGCFAARSGHDDQAIEALQRAVAINEHIKQLMASDDDLDSIREDPRFIELSK